MNAQPKPTPRRVLQRRHQRHKAAARAACVRAVWARANGCCERCGRACNLPREAAWFAAVGHVHERRSRAQGGDPTDPGNAELLCVTCHAAAHGIRSWLP